jgi:hypothetical protein
MQYVEPRLKLSQAWIVRESHIVVRRREETAWVDYFLEVLDVADLLYQRRFLLREIRSDMIKKLDEQVERFSYSSVLLHMDLLLRDSPEGPLLAQNGYRGHLRD